MMATTTNGTGDVTLTPPAAAADAEAFTPGGDDVAPEFILYMHNGEPVVYRRYEKEGGQ